MIHVAQSEITLKILQQLYANSFTLPKFFSADDPYSFGPLTSYSARLKFWQDLLSKAYGGKRSETLSDISEPPFLQKIKKILHKNAFLPIYVWDGGPCDEAILLRLFCYSFEHIEATINIVKVKPHNGVYALINHPSEKLLGAFAQAYPMSKKEISQMAQEFRRLKRLPQWLRFKDGKGIINPLPFSSYDAYILDSCDMTWKPALRVVGEALARCDAQNPLGDTFFINRLIHLLSLGQIEAANPNNEPRQLKIRLPSL